MKPGNMDKADLAVSVARRLEAWGDIVIAVARYGECDSDVVSCLISDSLEEDAARLRGLAAELAAE